MRVARFVIPGDPIGFVVTNNKAKVSEKYLRFAKYAKQVRFFARAAGIRLPLVATKQRPLMIRTVAYFANGRHCDPGNVQKGVVDALFYDEEKAALAKLQRKMGRRKRVTGKGDDKYTGGSFPPPRYDKDNPRVVVIIKEYEPPKRKKGNGKKVKGPREGRPQKTRQKASARTRKRNLQEA